MTLSGGSATSTEQGDDLQIRLDGITRPQAVLNARSRAVHITHAELLMDSHQYCS